MSDAPLRPIKILIAAMGGEGGGVLTDWLVRAAEAEEFPVQATSIPGVAQRTGATTYYVEILPRRQAELGGRRPVLALNPVPGDVDIMVATELLEAARAVANGFVTPDRTLLIASTHRVFSIAEKSAMGDGRLDAGRLLRAARDASRAEILFDMDTTAREAGSILNAVLLGALAGGAALPIPIERFEAGIRGEGKSVDSNLAGFSFGLAHARGEIAQQAAALETAARAIPQAGERSAHLAELVESFDPALHDLLRQAVARLIDYQDPAYAQLYLERLWQVQVAERQADGDAALTREVARHLAARMSFEDIVRVAQLKIAPGRFAQVGREIRAAPGQTFVVVDYFTPGIEEMCSLLPPFLARPILALSGRRGWLDKAHLGLRVKSNTVWGFLRLLLLSRLRFLRPFGHRYAEEQAALETWLGWVVQAASRDPALAREIAECARLVKGYGETHRRGRESLARIAAAVIEPALAGALPAPLAADAVANARVAALADPDGRRLDESIAAIRQAAGMARAAQ